jgi:hypothetical protein
MNYCPCCSGVLLQHVRGSEIAWFCRHCWSDMPVLTCNRSALLEEVIKEEIPQSINYVTQRQKITGWIAVKEVVI